MNKPKELKPCPFCGKNARIEDHYIGDALAPYYMVGCEDHRLDYCSDTKEEAANKWNKRERDELAAKLERVRRWADDALHEYDTPVSCKINTTYSYLDKISKECW